MFPWLCFFWFYLGAFLFDSYQYVAASIMLHISSINFDWGICISYFFISIVFIPGDVTGNMGVRQFFCYNYPGLVYPLFQIFLWEYVVPCSMISLVLLSDSGNMFHGIFQGYNFRSLCVMIFLATN